MALTKSTAGNRLIKNSGDNVIPRVPSAAYLSAVPVVGQFVKNSTTGNAVDRVTNGDPIFGVVISTNSGNGILSIARFDADCQLVCDYSGSVTVGDKVVGHGATGTVITNFDDVKTDNSNGTHVIIAKDANSPGGTGTCVIVGV
jgi:hypothetical protein